MVIDDTKKSDFYDSLWVSNLEWVSKIWQGVWCYLLFYSLECGSLVKIGTKWPKPHQGYWNRPTTNVVQCGVLDCNGCLGSYFWVTFVYQKSVVMKKIGFYLNLLFLLLVFWKTRFCKLLPAPERLAPLYLVSSSKWKPVLFCNTGVTTLPVWSLVLHEGGRGEVSYQILIFYWQDFFLSYSISTNNKHYLIQGDQKMHPMKISKFSWKSIIYLKK